MQISDELIKQAERLLLHHSQTFDDERRDFIKWLDSGDLMAVPGSGKTTALQAKLYCMAKQLPLECGEGILVISHTNTAVDELKKLLQKQCPQLFDYPNFVGTIQQFVDKYLAKPLYVSKRKIKVENIDADSYNRYFEKFLPLLYRLDPATYYKLENEYKHLKNIRFQYTDEGNVILISEFGGKPFDVPAIKRRDGSDGEDVKNKFCIRLAKIKKQIYEDGILHFDDGYFLADAYCKMYPQIMDIISHRFRYVFVDEAQDMLKHQLELLDLLFNNKPHVTFQRIGDPNQSIFNGLTPSKVVWVGRNFKILKKSFRLSSENADVVDHLILNRNIEGGQDNDGFKVDGVRKISTKIKPQLILYDNNRNGQLKQKFRELIIGFGLKDVDESKYGYHIIGWTAKQKNEDDKLHLESIFSEYKHNPQSTSSSTESLSKAIQNEKLINNFPSSRLTVLSSISHIMNLMDLKNSAGLRFTASRLEDEIEKRSDQEKEEFEVEVLDCTIKLTHGEWPTAYSLIERLACKTVSLFTDAGLNTEAMSFIGDKFEVQIKKESTVNTDDDISIEINTVHSAKGRTHCATMYVDTYYKGKYESEYLIKEVSEGRGKNKTIMLKSPFFGDELETNGVYDSMAKRMVYVGFSRPTHLLCYASEKKRWTDEAINKAKSAGWEIHILED